MATLRAPSPRFRRTEERPALQLTDDDDQILWHVFRHRVINSAMIYALLPHRSKQKLSRRLQSLWKAGYLDRPLQQIERYRSMSGSAPLVYTIDRHGAERLRDRFGVATTPSRWRQKNREFQSRSIAHSLSTTRFLVDLELAALARANCSLLHTDEVFRRFANRAAPEPGARLTVRSRVEWLGMVGEEGTAPDRIVALQYRDRPAGADCQILMLEIDQGSETIEPSERRLRSKSFFRDTSLLRKFVIYASAFRSRTHRTQLGLPAFRVLTVTTSPERVALMQESYQRHLSRQPHGVSPGLFLFTDWDSWSAQGPAERVVENGAGKPVALL